MRIPNKIEVRNISKTERGVFASFHIKKGEVIEMSPVILIPKNQQKVIDKTSVFNYYFYWGPKNQPALALGYGSLYNHSYQPNARYDHDEKRRLMIFRAIRDIKKGEEIRTNYNGDPDDQTKVWFPVKW